MGVCCLKVQHLVERALVGDQTDPDQFLAGAIQGAVVHAEPPADAAIGVVAQAPGIGHGDQKQVKGGGPVA